MSSKTSTVRLSSGERFARGLKHSASGPVDVTRGALGLGVNSARSSAAWLGSRYRRSARVAQETLAAELAAAQEVVSNLPETLQQARRTRRRPRPVVLAVAAVGVLAVGGVAFSIIRRSTQPDPSPRPPSVEVTPKV
jgi:Cell wall synthesis protein CwsA